MNKTLIWLVVAASIAVGALWYSFGGTTDMREGEQAQTAARTSLSSLLSTGISQKCEFTGPDGTSSGTAYIAYGKVRVDFTSATPAGTVTGHAIVADGTTHTWMDGMTTGVSVTNAAPTAPEAAQQGFDASAEADYSCAPWNGDPSLYALPPNVTFTDLSSLVPGASTGTTESGTGAPGVSAQCGACDLAPEPQRSQCRAALQCK